VTVYRHRQTAPQPGDFQGMKFKCFRITLSYAQRASVSPLGLNTHLLVEGSKSIHELGAAR
jgi:hypothetical protein